MIVFTILVAVIKSQNLPSFCSPTIMVGVRNLFCHWKRKWFLVSIIIIIVAFVFVSFIYWQRERPCFGIYYVPGLGYVYSEGRGFVQKTICRGGSTLFSPITKKIEIKEFLIESQNIGL
jgi:hypothetical protein